MELVQVSFIQPYPNPTRGMKVKVVWVDASWLLKKGDIVSFKDETERWTVETVYNTKATVEELDKRWGLELPKSQRTER